MAFRLSFLFPALSFACLFLVYNSTRLVHFKSIFRDDDTHPTLYNADATVSYSMKRCTSYNLTFAQNNQCPLGVHRNKWGRHAKYREPLMETLQPLLNFTTTIRTHQNILVMGDSVAIQFGQLLEEAMGSNAETRQVIHNSWAGNEGITISQTKSWSAIALYRLTGMFLPSGEGQPLPNAPGGGWNQSHVQALLRHPYLLKNGKPQKFHVLIFRIPHGWLTWEEITAETIQQSLQLAHDLFGVTQAILIDIPFTNNVKTVQDLAAKKQTNAMIQHVASLYPLPGSGVTKVTTLQFSRWTDHLMEYNARVIGLLPNDHSFVGNKSYSLDRLGCRRPRYALSIAQGCAEFARAGDCQCRRNRISEDGMHWCLESLGGRLVAGLACLLTCLQYDDDDEGLRDCERQCNNLFMSLHVPDDEMFDE